MRIDLGTMSWNGITDGSEQHSRQINQTIVAELVKLRRVLRGNRDKRSAQLRAAEGANGRWWLLGEADASVGPTRTLRAEMADDQLEALAGALQTERITRQPLHVA